MRTHGWMRAVKAVHLAVKRGELQKINPSTLCVDCGSPAKEYDHRDYNKPLVVEPVCKRCNQKRGRAIPWIGKKAERKCIHGSVFFDKNRNRWRGELTKHGVRRRTKRFASKESAELAVDALSRSLALL